MGKSVIIGTAGHIDHGKSSLIKALTGTNPDRLKEEQKRGITIDLGYAGLTIDDIVISFIDVPGHEDYVKNMIAGATSFDMALVAVDAQEGVKAQTVEHTNIIKSTGIKQVIVAITKTDLVDDASLYQNISNIKAFFNKYNFEKIDFFPVSIHNTQSIEKLKNLLVEYALTFHSDNINRPFYFRIDRVFSKKGFGVVVTGSCLFGKVDINDELSILPKNKKVKVRNIACHGQAKSTGCAHERLALNISGLELTETKRGDILANCNKYRLFREYICKIDVFKNLEKDFILKNNKLYHIFIGTDHFDAKIIMLDKKEIKNGEYAYCKIMLSKDYPAFAQEIFFIRGLEPVTTVAAGKILSPGINVKNKLLGEALNKNSLLESLKYIFENVSKGLYFYTDTQYFDFEIDKILKEINVLSFDSLKISANLISRWLKTIRSELKTNETIDISKIISLEYLKNSRFYNFIKKLIEQKILDNEFKINNFLIEKIKKSAFEEVAQKVLKLMEEDVSISNKTLISQEADIHIADAEKILKMLSNRDLVKKIDENVYISTKKLSEFIELARKTASTHGYVDISNIKLSFHAPRKILIPLLDYLDKLPIFVKVGNKRFLKSKPQK